jgi:hypothetical protein
MHRSRSLYVVVAGLGALVWAAVDQPISRSRARSESHAVDTEAASVPVSETPKAEHSAPARISAVAKATDVPKQRTHSPPNLDDPPDTETGPVEPDEVMFDYDNRPEQREWRGAFYAEQHDPVWTERMNEQLQDRAAQALTGDLQIVKSSCRQHFCRIYLQFDDARDAEAFQNVDHDPGVHYEFQNLDPFHSGEGLEGSAFTYELLVKRNERE